MVAVQRHDRAAVVVVDRAGLRRALSLALGRRHGRLPRPAAVHPPQRVEAQYFLALQRVIASLRDSVRTSIVPKIGDLVRSAPVEIHRGDEVERHDVFSEKIEDAVRPIRVRFTSMVQTQVSRAANETAKKVSDENKKGQQRAMESVFGIRPELSEPWLTPMIDSFVRDNARLVTGVGTQFLDALEHRVGNGVRQGLRAEDIAKGIASDFVSKQGIEASKANRRAALIARDQVGSFFGDLTRVRQERLGISRYKWVTVHDERVRESHRERDGVVFSWSPIEPQLRAKRLEVDKIDGHPGIPLACRCIAEPVLDDLIETGSEEPDDAGLEPVAEAEPEPAATDEGDLVLHAEPSPTEIDRNLGLMSESTPKVLHAVTPPGDLLKASGVRPIVHAQPVIPTQATHESPETKSARKAFVSGEIVESEHLGGGANSSLKVTLRDPDTGANRQAVLKPSSGEEVLRGNIEAGTYYRREAAAYQVDRLIGGAPIVPLTVTRNDPDYGWSSVQQFQPGSVLSKTPELEHITPERMANEPSVRRLWLLDLITGNSDRHDGNVMIRRAKTETGFEVIAIDNGLTFPKDPKKFGGASGFIFPTELGGLGNTLTNLDDHSHRTVKSLDLNELAATLKASEIESDAARATLVRTRALQLDPAIVDKVDPTRETGMGKAQSFVGWSSSKYRGKLIPEAEHQAIDRIIDETFK